MQQPLPPLRDVPVTFAHRGARTHAPENTIEAFQLALRLGASGLETDAWLTSDGVVVLDHDGSVRRGRSVRRRPIARMRRDELPPSIPSLAELIDACGTDYELSIDVNEPAAGSAIAATVRAAGMAENTWLCHPDVDLLASWRDDLADLKLVNSTRLARITEGPERRAARLSAEGIDGINMHRTDWNGGLVVLFHRFDLFAFGWDLRYEHQMTPALLMGLDGVYADDVDMMQTCFSTVYGN